MIAFHSNTRDSGTSSAGRLSIDEVMEGHYEVLSFNFNGLLYNVHANNKRVPFQEGTSKVATLTEGAYTLSSFLLELGSKMTVASGVQTYTATFGNDTNLLTVTSAGAVTWGFEFETDSSLTAKYLMGFTGDTTVDLNPATGTNVVDMNFPKQLHIQIDENLSKHRSSKTHSWDLIFPIEYNNSQFYSGVQQTLNFRPTQHIKYSFLDETGLTYDLKGLEWTLILKGLDQIEIAKKRFWNLASKIDLSKATSLLSFL